MQKQTDSKLKPAKSNKNLNPSSVVKVAPRKTKEKSGQKSLSRKKKKIVNDSFEEEGTCAQQLHNEYYNKEKRQPKKNQHDNNNFSQYSNITNLISSGKNFERPEVANPGKLNLDKVKGVITFDGKYLKNNLESNNHKSPANWEYSSQHYTEMASRQETRKNKNKSKSKSRNKKVSHDSKPKNKLKQSKKENKEKIGGSRNNLAKYTPGSETQFGEETTKNTPRRTFSTYERNEEVDIETVKAEIKEDRLKIWKINMLKKVSFEKRAQCISIISRICGDMQFRKQVFTLAIHLFDSYLNDQVMISRHKVLSLACLLLALKLQEAELANIFYVQLSAINLKSGEIERDSKQDEGFRGSRSTGKEKDRTKKKQKTKQAEQAKQRNQKQQQIYQKFKILRAILKKQMEETFTKNQLLELQTMVLLKEDFRVWKRTYSYWADVLTMMWDQFLLQDCLDNYGNLDYLLFRCLTKTKNFAYLVQILEASLYTTQFYSYSLMSIVLSAMYLLIRINMEGNEEGFQYYRTNLQKSGNILFVDMAGVNVIFGQFLNKIDVEMGQILSCCQFLSTYLNQSILMDFDYEQLPAEKFDHTLSIHFHNPKLFPF